MEEMLVANAFFLPESLQISSDAQTQTLHRGIYDAAVFRAQVKMSGKFAPPDFGALKIDLKDVQWKDAFVTIAVSDLRGTREGLVLDWNGAKHSLQPGSQLPGYTTGATALLASDQPIDQAAEFSIALDVNGSGGIFFAPFGVQNDATLKSNWPDPGFRGAFLPAERSVRADGFDAKWKVSYYGRDYPQAWTSIAAISVSMRKRFPRPFSARNFFRFSTRIASSNDRSSMACFFSSSFSRRSFSLR